MRGNETAVPFRRVRRSVKIWASSSEGDDLDTLQRVSENAGKTGSEPTTLSGQNSCGNGGRLGSIRPDRPADTVPSS